MKNTIIICAAILMSLFVFAIASPVVAQYSVGVKSGDWIKYNFNINIEGMPYSAQLK